MLLSAAIVIYSVLFRTSQMRWSLCCWLDFLPLAAGPELDRVLVLDTELAATRGLLNSSAQYTVQDIVVLADV